MFVVIDLSRIPVNKGTNSRLRWTKYSDLYEIIHPSLDLVSLCRSLERNAGKVYKASRFKNGNNLILFLRTQNEL